MQEAESVSFGVALYVPAENKLYLRFREDLCLDDPDDEMFIAESSTTLRNIAFDLGAKATFDWMSDTLCNTIFVEGPNDVVTDDPPNTLSELCERYCKHRTA
jgi:hypothetical protein